jgi:hypothetical protein
MVEVTLNPYSSFRDADFTAIVEEMGIKEFGEKAIRKAFIGFADEGAPLTFQIEKKDGTSLIESDPARNIKAITDIGKFATAANKFGYKVVIDTDEDIFKTVPSLEGKKTSWEMIPGRKYTDDNGEQRDGFATFVLVKIEEDGKIPAGVTTALQGAPTQPAKANDLEEQIEAWKEVLVMVLTEPKNEAGILKGVNTIKPDSDARKAMHKARKAVLAELVKAKFLVLDADGKYSVNA